MGERERERERKINLPFKNSLSQNILQRLHVSSISIRTTYDVIRLELIL